MRYDPDLGRCEFVHNASVGHTWTEDDILGNILRLGISSIEGEESSFPLEAVALITVLGVLVLAMPALLFLV